MRKILRMIGLHIGVLLLLALATGCPQPDNNPYVNVNSVAIESGGVDLTGLMYVLWEPSDTNDNHPKTVQLNAVAGPQNASEKDVAWSVSPSGIVSVSSSGLVMAENEGQAIVSAKAGEITASVEIRVMKAGMELIPVISVSITLGEDEQIAALTKYVGDTIALSAVVLPADATITEVIWESSDEDIASIDEGVITAKQRGSTTIAVKTRALKADGSPATASFTLNVWPNPGWMPSPGYLNKPLDLGNPVFFYGNRLEYKGNTIPLGPYSIYIDGSFTDAEIENFHALGYPIYNDFYKVFESEAERKHDWNAAVKTDGTAENPFTVYYAPWVHWIDDPDNPEVYNTTTRGTAVSMQSIPYLRFTGLTDDYRNVVIAADRGQGVGAQGNFTFFSGGGGGNWIFENISICSYANFDLIFPLDDYLPDNFESRKVVGMNQTTKKFSRPMRSVGIGQSQISLNGGANFLAKNCAFWSKHNSSLPSGNQTFYYKCSLEGGQHGMSWGNTTMYYESSVGLWGSQNGGSTGNFAALNCDIYLRGSGSHGFGDGAGTGNSALIDCRIISGDSGRNLAWTKSPPLVYRGYQSGVTYLIDSDSNMVPGDGQGTKLTTKTERGSPYTVNLTGCEPGDPQYRPDISVDISGTEALKAYKFISGGKTYYNYINVMNTTFDPLEILPVVQSEGLTNVARTMSISLVTTGTGADAQSVPASGTAIKVGNTTDGGDRKTLSHSGSPSGYNVSWRLAPANSQDSNDAVTTVAAGTGTPVVGDGHFRVLPNNTRSAPLDVLVEAVSDFGLRASYNIVSWPADERAPSFVTNPKIVNLNDGRLKAEYDIGLQPDLNDWSTINWYKSDNVNGTGNKTLVWTTRTNISIAANSLNWLEYRPPEYIYRVQYSDIGKYITVEVTPRHSKSVAGTASDMKADTYSTAITQADWRLTIDYPTFDGFPNIRTAPASGNTQTRNAALNPAKPPASRLVPGVWNADIADPPEMLTSGRNMSNGNWSNANAWAWTTPATNNNDKRPGMLQQAVGSRLYYIPPPKAGGGKYSDMEITWTFGHPKGNTYGGSAPQYFDVLFNFDFEAGTGYAVRLQRTGAGSSNSAAAGIVKYRGWGEDTTDRATVASTHPFGGFTDPVMPRPLAAEENDVGLAEGNPLRYGTDWWTTRPNISFRTYYTINIKVVNGKITVTGRSTGSSDNTDFDVYSESATYNFDFEYTIPAGDTAWLNHPGGFGVWTPGTSGAGAASNDNSLSLRRLKVTWGN